MTQLFITAMTAIAAWAQRSRDDEDGAAAVEYGLLVALIAAVIVSTVALLGPRILAAFQAVIDSLTAAGV